MRVWQPQASVANDANIFNCTDDMDSCICGLFCPFAVFGRVRQRAGIGEFYCSCALFALFYCFLPGQAYNQFLLAPQQAYQNCVVSAETFGPGAPADDPGCSSALQTYTDAQNKYSLIVGLCTFFLALFVSADRAQLQQITAGIACLLRPLRFIPKCMRR